MEELLKKIFKDDKAKVLTPLSGGMMNQSYIVEHDNKRYVLYVSTDQANEMVDRSLERDNQKLVIDLGITSKNIYFDTEKGIKVNEYIDGKSLNYLDSFDAKKVASLLKKLHSSKALSKEDYHPFARFIAYEDEADTFDIQRSEDYKELRATLFQNKDFLESQPLVLSHNDAQKSNIVCDSKGEYYLIDFEFVGNNDEIYDIATFGNGLVKEGYEVLVEYYNGNPSKEEKLRYYLWRIFVSLQWHNVAIVKHYRGEGALHGFDFLAVADFFLNNAKDALAGLKNIE